MNFQGKKMLWQNVSLCFLLAALCVAPEVYNMIHHDKGTLIYSRFILFSFPFLFASGVYFYCRFRNISFHRIANALKDLESHREFTSLIVNESKNVVCVIDDCNNIHLVNKKFREVFNFEKNERLKDVNEALRKRPEIASLFNPEHVAANTGSANNVYECYLKIETNGEKWFKVQTSQFKNKKQQTFKVFIANDISAEHTTEATLIKAHNMVENSLKMKEQFIANMSHEIRTPLNAIIGFTDLLTDTSLDAQQKDYVQTVKIAGQNLLGIINDILDLSKIETGNFQLNEKPFNLHSVINDTKKLFEPKVREQNIELNVIASNDLPALVFSDKMRLSQILINLVGNAVKFTSTGKVDIIVNKVQGNNPGRTYIQFSIKDTGIGIDKNQVDVIFQRYSQASENIHRLYGGTGLGLSICKNLVELFGGEISVTSQLGQGTTFSFIIPFVCEGEVVKKEMKPQLVHSAPGLHKSLKILLAEDNHTNAKLAMQILKKQNFTVHRVCDGSEVVEALEQNDYDLILMDVQMEKQDGIETAQIIRSMNAPFSNIPIIALTAHSFTGERNVCSDAGMNAYVSKPFSPQELYSAINKVLTSKERHLRLESVEGMRA